MANITLKQLDAQLKQIGCNFRFWGRAELKELANVLLPGEQIRHCINGQYEGGFAMLCATDQRVLLIDKKPMYLTLEDIRFDMVAEIDYNHRLLNSTMHICTPNKMLRFTAYNQDRLRAFFVYVQQRVMDIRQHYMHQMEAQEQVTAVSEPQQLAAPAAAQPPGVSTNSTEQAESFSAPYLASQTISTNGVASPQGQVSSSKTVPARVVAPIVSAYTRLPLMSRQRRYLGSRAMNTPLPSMYNNHR